MTEPASFQSIREVVDSSVIPSLEERLRKVLGKRVPLLVDWTSLEDSVDAASLILKRGSHFVIHPIVDILESTCKNHKHAVSQVGRSQDICSRTTSQLRWVCTLYAQCAFQLGLGGVYSKRQLRETLWKIAGVGKKRYTSRIMKHTLPAWQRAFQEVLAISDRQTIEVEMDWSSFAQSRDNEEAALCLFAHNNGHACLQPLLSGLQQATAGDNQASRTEALAGLVKRVVVVNEPCPTQGPRAGSLQGRVFVHPSEHGTLVVSGPWERGRRAVPAVADVAEVLGIAVTATSPSHSGRMPLLRRVDALPQTAAGLPEMLRWLLAHSPFRTLDAADQHAVDTFVATYVAAPTSGAGWDVDAAPPEVAIGGYSCSKLNFRGQQQDRLVVVTSRAMYTFAYDYARRAVDACRVHVHCHCDYAALAVGPLVDTPHDPAARHRPEPSYESFPSAAPPSKHDRPRYAVRYTTAKAYGGGVPRRAPGTPLAVRTAYAVLRHLVDAGLRPEEVHVWRELPSAELPTVSAVLRRALQAVGRLAALRVSDELALDEALALVIEGAEALEGEEPLVEGLLFPKVVELSALLHRAFDSVEHAQRTIAWDLPSDSHLHVLPCLEHLKRALQEDSGSALTLQLPGTASVNLVELLSAAKEACIASWGTAPLPQQPPLQIASLPNWAQLEPTAVASMLLHLIDILLDALRALGTNAPQLELAFEPPTVPVIEVIELACHRARQKAIPSVSRAAMDLSEPEQPAAQPPAQANTLMKLGKGVMGFFQQTVAKVVASRPPTVEVVLCPHAQGPDEELALAHELAWTLYAAAKLSPGTCPTPPRNHPIYMSPSALGTLYNKLSQGSSNKK